MSKNRLTQHISHITQINEAILPNESKFDKKAALEINFNDVSNKA